MISRNVPLSRDQIADERRLTGGDQHDRNRPRRDALIDETFERRRRIDGAAVLQMSIDVEMRDARGNEHAHDAAIDERVEIAGERLEDAHVALDRNRSPFSTRDIDK
jgi:hypothetical protein